MKRIPPLLFLTMLTLVVLGVLFVSPPTVSITPPVSPTATNTPATKPYPPLNELIGQLFMIGHWADHPVSSTTALIKTHHLGGVILMSTPSSTAEIPRWVDTWNTAADYPLFIAIDQEGGSVSRLKSAPYATTSQQHITTADEAFTIGLARGKNLHALGINLNFAPVLETANHPNSFLYDRTFPKDTDHAALAAALISGMAESEVAGVVKHFPGHADTPEDSHTLLPQVSITRQELDAFTQAFRTLITDNTPLAIMTAHVRYPLIDDQPATLSSFFLTDYLRGELDFAGIIITDDLIMRAIATTTPSDQAAVAALLAGADVCLFAAEPEKVTAAIAAVTAAVDSGLLSEARLRLSFDRVQHTKTQLQLR